MQKFKKLSETIPNLQIPVIRLGVVHLPMSYLGAIGYIITGSVLKDLFTTVHAENSVEKMLAGHAYDRAIHAYILCHLALGHLVMESIEFSDEDHDVMKEILENVVKSTSLRANES